MTLGEFRAQNPDKKIEIYVDEGDGIFVLDILGEDGITEEREQRTVIDTNEVNATYVVVTVLPVQL